MALIKWPLAGLIYRKFLTSEYRHLITDKAFGP